MLNFLPYLLVLVLALLATWFYLKNLKLGQKLKDLEQNPEYWKILPPEQVDQFTQKTAGIFDQLKEETETLVKEEAKDLNQFETIYQQKFEQLSDQVSKRLEEQLTQINSLLEKNLTTSQKENVQFLDTQQKQIMQWQDAVEVETKNRINSFLENFESNMAQFFANAEQSSLTSINLEIKSARNLIESYKAQQLEIVEENIVAVLERTLSIVLKQKLTLKDQMDLVYEALEKAKLEKFLV